MFLFAILFVLLTVLLVITALVIGATGAIGIILFGDVIVCMAIIVWLLKKRINKSKK